MGRVFELFDSRVSNFRFKEKKRSCTFHLLTFIWNIMRENFARPESFSGVDDDIITFLIILLS